MKDAGEDLFHVSVIPRGHLPAALQTGLRDVMTADKVDRDFAEQREVLHGFAISYLAVVFIEGDVQHPVQAVFDLPMPADCFR